MAAKQRLNVVWIASEAVPYAKVGGLADVCGAVVPMLARMGHRMVLFLPRYRSLNLPENGAAKVFDFAVPMADGSVRAGLWAAGFPGSKAIVYLVEGGGYFDREGMYVDPETGKPYPDEAKRYIFFCRAVLEAVKRLDVRVDILHCHDNQTALLTAYLKRDIGRHPNLDRTRSFYTVHNLGYQGHFPPETAVAAGFAPEEFYPMSPVEFYGHFNFMKVGLTHADYLTTVSPQYAIEIQRSPELGHGMEGILYSRRNRLFGILNGVDYSVWNPEKDRLIEARYSINHMAGKRRNKAVVIKLVGLPKSRLELPLVGMISRLADQKGFDLVEAASTELMSGKMNLVVLGTGDPKYHRLLEKLKNRYPDRIGINLYFSERLAHLIEAGCDIFLMPSRYEPCGLNQMYSLKYGTVPVVRATGGLADTVIDFDADPERGNGFTFEDYAPSALMDAVNRALKWFGQKKVWRQIVRRGMEADFSWERAANRYVELYYQALSE